MLRDVQQVVVAQALRALGDDGPCRLDDRREDVEVLEVAQQPDLALACFAEAGRVEALGLVDVRLAVAFDDRRQGLPVLADALGVNQSNASRIVDRLASQGLVRRIRDRDDGRASLVALTPEGQRVLDAVHDHRLEVLLGVVRRMRGGSHGLAGALAQLSEAAADGHALDRGQTRTVEG